MGIRRETGLFLFSSNNMHTCVMVNPSLPRQQTPKNPAGCVMNKENSNRRKNSGERGRATIKLCMRLIEKRRVMSKCINSEIRINSFFACCSYEYIGRNFKKRGQYVSNLRYFHTLHLIAQKWF